MANRQLSLIPQPVSLVTSEGYFRLDSDTVMVADGAAIRSAEMLAGQLRGATGLPLPIAATAPSQNVIRLTIEDSSDFENREAYRLDVTPAVVELRASAEAGLFYAAQTLRQLLPAPVFGQSRPTESVEWTVPCVQIQDAPRFVWRGAMLDVGRHFKPVEFVKRFIDLLALHKMNIFHWHLSDDQGWRVEIKRYPRLTQVGSIRPYTLIGHHNDRPHRFDDRPHGGFYTQDEIREIVAYAAERQITIVPEIDMPGHMDAAISAYPELGNLPMILQPRCTWGISQHILNPQESTVRFMQNVLEELLELFPGDFIHVGGDEALKHEWEESRAAQSRMAELGLKSEAELQSWFIGQMDTFLSERGRRLIGWDEILEGGLAPGASVMSWRGMEGGVEAARAGHDVVMAPTGWTYFDYHQSADTENEPLAIGGYLPLERVYELEPVPAELTAEEAKHILGAQCQHWSEYMPEGRDVEYMAFPRLCALAEVVWSPATQRDYADFSGRLSAHLQRLDALEVNYWRGD